MITRWKRVCEFEIFLWGSHLIISYWSLCLCPLFSLPRSPGNIPECPSGTEPLPGTAGDRCAAEAPWLFQLARLPFQCPRWYHWTVWHREWSGPRTWGTEHPSRTWVLNPDRSLPAPSAQHRWMEWKKKQTKVCLRLTKWQMETYNFTSWFSLSTREARDLPDGATWVSLLSSYTEKVLNCSTTGTTFDFLAPYSTFSSTLRFLTSRKTCWKEQKTKKTNSTIWSTYYIR